VSFILAGLCVAPRMLCADAAAKSPCSTMACSAHIAFNLTRNACGGRLGGWGGEVQVKQSQESVTGRVASAALTPPRGQKRLSRTSSGRGVRINAAAVQRLLDEPGCGGGRLNAQDEHGQVSGPLQLRVRVEIMGSPKCGIVGKSQ
jgi:hypothetical protein